MYLDKCLNMFKSLFASIFTVSILLFSFANSQAQSITGTWKGNLIIGSSALPIVFHIKDSAATYTATMDSPEQEAYGIPVDKVSFANGMLSLQITKAHINYRAQLLGDTLLKGVFKQAIIKKELLLRPATNHNVQAKVVNHPQTPTAPFSYSVNEVRFPSADSKVLLAGSLTMPSNTNTYPVPAVVLITGSGPQDRDESLLGHKPFLVLADYLTRFGYAVLRYDDRGTAASTGKFKGATTFDFINDAQGAANFLRKQPGIDTARIGLIGHSEGGLIAPMLALQDPRITFIVLLAGPAMRGAELLPLQMEKVARASGTWNDTMSQEIKVYAQAFQVIAGTQNNLVLRHKLFHYFYKHFSEIPSAKQLHSNRFLWAYLETKLWMDPWMRTFLQINPMDYLTRVAPHCPILALNGSLDMQVPSAENLSLMRQAIKQGDPRSKVVELEKLNHLFQEAKTGSPKEYAKIEETFNVGAITEILNWMTMICTK